MTGSQIEIGLEQKEDLKVLPNRNFWIKKGRVYLEREELSIPNKYLNRKENRILRKRIDPYGKISVIDLGCANGFSTIAINRPGTNRVYAIDINADFVESAIRLRDQLNLKGIEFVAADMRCLPFPDEFFDVAYAKRSFMNIPSITHQNMALREAARVLKHNGTLLISDLFLEGFRKLNRIRQRIGYAPLRDPEHLLFLEENLLRREADPYFMAEKEEDFTSTYYLIVKGLSPSTKSEPLKILDYICSFLPSIGRIGINKLITLRKK